MTPFLIEMSRGLFLYILCVAADVLFLFIFCSQTFPLSPTQTSSAPPPPQVMEKCGNRDQVLGALQCDLGHLRHRAPVTKVLKLFDGRAALVCNAPGSGVRQRSPPSGGSPVPCPAPSHCWGMATQNH